LGIAVGCGLDGQGSTANKDKIFLFSTASSLALTPPPPIQWVPWAFSPEVKRSGCEADHSPPSSAEVKNTWDRVELVKSDKFCLYLSVEVGNPKVVNG
jgi:hypothetical protein